MKAPWTWWRERRRAKVAARLMAEVEAIRQNARNAETIHQAWQDFERVRTARGRIVHGWDALPSEVPPPGCIDNPAKTA